MRRNKEYNVLIGGACFIVLVVLIFIAIIANAASNQQTLEVEYDVPEGVIVTSNGEDEFTIQLAQATVNVKIKVKSVTSVVPTPAPPTPGPTPTPSPTPSPPPDSLIVSEDCSGEYLDATGLDTPDTGTDWEKVEDTGGSARFTFSDAPNTCMAYPNQVSQRVLYKAVPEPETIDSALDFVMTRFCDTASTCTTWTTGGFLNYIDNCNYYAAQFYGSATSEDTKRIRIGKVVDCDRTSLADTFVALTASDVFRFERIGSDLTVYINGTEILSAEDSDLITGGGAGIFAGNAIIETDKAHTVNQIDDFHVYENTESEPRPTPSPTPSPTASPAPTPAPTATPSPVVCNSSVNAGSSIQNAINAASAGQTVCPNAGTHNITGTGQLLGKANVHIYCKEGAVLNFNQAQNSGLRFNSNAGGGSVQNCEIKNAWNGIFIGASNVQALDNYIHDNLFQGILKTAGSYAVMAGNTIEDNGASCTQDIWGGYSPRHCHSIYISNPSGFCSNQVGDIIRNNYLGPEGGVGVNFNGQPCPSHKIDQTLIEGNQIVNTNSGVALWYGTSNTVIKNNDFVIQDPPTSNMPNSLKYAVTLWGGGGVTRTGNTYSLMSGYGEFATYQ